MDKVLNPSSQNISTMLSQITFSLACDIKELDSAHFPFSGESDLWLCSLTVQTINCWDRQKRQLGFLFEIMRFSSLFFHLTVRKKNKIWKSLNHSKTFKLTFGQKYLVLFCFSLFNFFQMAWNFKIILILITDRSMQSCGQFWFWWILILIQFLQNISSVISTGETTSLKNKQEKKT